MEVLVVLARAANRTVTRDELIAACWAGRFVTDDAVARVVAKVRDLGRALDPRPFTLETVPKVGFRLVTASGAGVADAPASGGSGSTSRGLRRLPPRRAARLLAGLGILLAVAAGWAFWRAAPSSGQNGRVEVVLFEPLQPDPALRRFSVALGDAVVRMLATNGVETAQKPVPRDAGGDGTAEFRIAGTVDRDGDRFVANAQIIERRSGSVLWSGRIDRPTGSAVGFHEQAANTIVDTLHCALGHRTASNRPVTTSVFGMLLNVCAVRRGYDPQRFLELARRLSDAAPDLSIAHSLHAFAAANNSRNSNVNATQASALRKEAKRASDRALALDVSNGEAHFALGVAAPDWFTEEQHYLRAAALSPRLSGMASYHAPLLRTVGRLDEAIEATRRTVANDPFSGYQLRGYAFLLGAAGHRAEAEAAMERLALIDPERGRDARIQIAFWWYEPDQVRSQLRALPAGWYTDNLPCYDKYLERLPRARAGEVRGLPDECADLQLDWRLRMLARQGDVDAAYAEFARAPLERGNTLWWLFYPELKAFRQDPRFMPLAKRLGFVDYWLKSGHWPDFCREPDLPYDCKAVARSL